MAAQLVLDDRWTALPHAAGSQPARRDERRDKRADARKPVLCAACAAREARYGFREEGDDPHVGRPRTLCFECFRAEIARRQEAAQTVQVRLPLEDTLDALSLRRRRAQIAARRALAVSGL
jgi:hypothetical protein